MTILRFVLSLIAALVIIVVGLAVAGTIIGAVRPDPCDSGQCDALTCQSVTGDVVIRLGECPSGYVEVERVSSP